MGRERGEVRLLRALPVTLAAVLMLPGHALAAPNEVSVQRRTITIDVPVDEDLAGPLSSRAEQMAEEIGRAPIHGCILLDIRPSRSEEGHAVQVVPQRAGQFVRITANDANPYEEERTLMVEAHDLETEPGTERVMNALLLREQAALLRGDVSFSGRGLQAAIAMDVAEILDRQPSCRYRGTADITVRHPPFNLTVSTTLSFRFSIHADGSLEGDVSPATRRATGPFDPGGPADCSTDSASMSPIRLLGGSDGRTIELDFRPQGREPDLELACPGGTSTYTGRYVGDFLLQVRPPVEIKARDGATTSRRTPRDRGGPARGTFRIRLAG